MRRIVFCFMLSAALSGCAGSDYTRSPVVTAQHMACAGNHPAAITLYSPSEAVLRYEDKSYELNRIETASGIQYGNSDVVFWNKGIDAMIIRDDGTTTSCTYIPKSGL